MGKRALLEFHVSVQVDLGRFRGFAAEPEAITVRSTPRRSSAMAAECRSVWGAIRFVASDGHTCRALATCRETSRWTASALSRRLPRALGKTKAA